MKWLRRLYYKVFPTYKRTNFQITDWDTADKMIKENPLWEIAPEDEMLSYPQVAIEIRERVCE